MKIYISNDGTNNWRDLQEAHTTTSGDSMTYPLRQEQWKLSQQSAMCANCHSITGDWHRLPTNGATWCIKCIGKAIESFKDSRRARIGRDTYQSMVSEFHRMIEVEEATQPTPIDHKTAALRLRLMRDELEEVGEALQAADVKQIAKELADLLYTAIGTANVCGLDMAAVFQAVHISNMSKRDANGHVIRDSTGKVLKPATYQEPDLSFLEFDCV